MMEMFVSGFVFGYVACIASAAIFMLVDRAGFRDDKTNRKDM